MMTVNVFSDEDYQLSAANQLGMPLHVYRLKRGYLRFQRMTSWCFIITGIVVLIAAFIPASAALPVPAVGEIAGGLYALCHGGIFYGIMDRRARSLRVIICEDGILQVRKMFVRNNVEIAHWKDILTINKTPLSKDHVIVCRSSLVPFTISSYYQNGNELVTLIREYCSREETV